MLNAQAAQEGRATTRKKPSQASSAITTLNSDTGEAWFTRHIKQSTPHAEKVWLTPGMAKYLLERNECNRPINEVRMRDFGRDVMEGRFVFNGEPIIISCDGKMNDGQHRCEAVVRTNKSIETFIVFGVTRESRFTVDQGQARTVGHYLAMNGVPNSNNVGAIASYIWQYKELGRLTLSAKERGTKSQLLLVAHSYPDILDSIRAIDGRQRHLICSISVIAFCHWVLSRNSHATNVKDFFDRLLRGHSLDKGSPILACRNRLMLVKKYKDVNMKAEIILRSWNLWRLGKSTRGITVHGGKLPIIES